MKPVLRLIISLVVAQAAGLVGAIFTMPKIATWYTTLKKPPFQPPNWLFGPAWTLLFLLMGIALFFIWNAGLPFPSIRTAIVFFVVQFVLNILWNVMFFGLQSPLAGLVEIAVLWVAILLTIIHFWPISRPAGILLLPYIGWVSFATLLNAAVVYLNRPA